MVHDKDRVPQVLKPGYTYQTHLKGSIRGPAENKKWAINVVVDVLYMFEAFIDREIVSNDGTTIVEIRTFRDVKSLDIHGKLPDVKIELGRAGQVLFALKPLYAMMFGSNSGCVKRSVSSLRFQRN